MPCTVTVEVPCQLVCIDLPAAIFSNDRRAREQK